MSNSNLNQRSGTDSMSVWPNPFEESVFRIHLRLKARSTKISEPIDRHLYRVLDKYAILRSSTEYKSDWISKLVRWCCMCAVFFRNLIILACSYCLNRTSSSYHAHLFVPEDSLASKLLLSVGFIVSCSPSSSSSSFSRLLPHHVPVSEL